MPPEDPLQLAAGLGTSLCLRGGWLGAAGASRRDAAVGGGVAAAESLLLVLAARGEEAPVQQPGPFQEGSWL